MPATYLGCQMAQPRLGGQEPCPVAFSTAFESTVSFYTFTCFLRCICFGVGVCLSIPISISRDDVSRGSPWFSHVSFPPTRLFGTRVGSSDSESLHRLRSRIETCARSLHDRGFRVYSSSNTRSCGPGVHIHVFTRRFGSHLFLLVLLVRLLTSRNPPTPSFSFLRVLRNTSMALCGVENAVGKLHQNHTNRTDRSHRYFQKRWR